MKRPKKVHLAKKLGIGLSVFSIEIVIFVPNYFVMIISLKVKNFYSLRDEAVLDFTADMSSKSSREVLPENLLDFNGDKFVNIIGLFGGNAAGKSNIIRAIDFCRHLVINSHLSNEGDQFDFQPFKFDIQKPSEFYINFVVDNIEYEYFFEIMSGKIITEGLYYFPKKRRAKVFLRENTSFYTYGKGLISRPTEIESNTGPKTLFLSRASSMNKDIPKIVYRYFLENIITEIRGFDLKNLTKEDIENNKTILLKALEVSDSDIVDIRWNESVAGRPNLQSFHRENPEIPFDFDTEESEGTKRLLYILVMLLKRIPENCSVFLDEFDLKLHLYLAQYILDVVRASKGMQLVFTSHNPILIDMSKLRPEQIVFVSKERNGNSEFVSLSDYEGIKNISDIRKAYLQGRFDGVPYIGNVASFISETFGIR